VLRKVGAKPKVPPPSNRKTPHNRVDGLARVAIEALPAAVYMTDAEGRITFYNEAAAVLWGCRPELGENMFCGSWKLYWPDGTPLPHEECPMAMALRQRRPIRGMEAIAERPDGTRVPFIPYPTPLFDALGRLTGAVNMLVDISDRKHTASRLAERNAQLDLAEKIARIGSLTFDQATETLQLSPGCAAIYGLPEGTLEISREEWRALVHPDDLPRLDAIVRRALANGESELVLEFRILHRSEVRWIESRVLVSYNEAGKAVRRIGANIDVTERKQAELALAERNAQFDLAHKAARVGCYTHDFSAKTMLISRASMATYGLSKSTMEITAQEWHARVHREDVQRLRAEHILAFKERRPELVSEFRIVRPGGEVRWIESRSLIAYNPVGRAERMTGVYIDVTERRIAEDNKKLLIAELDHRVKNVLACVAAIAQRSHESSRSVDEFLDVLNGRINSLANTHALLSRSRWEGVGLGELVRNGLAFCTKDESLLIEGPEVDLAAMATQALAMVLHELATNAAKYGALSNGHGRVVVRWRLRSRGPSRGKLVLKWRETGGPRVVVPNATGYGTSVIRDLIPYELGGVVDYQLAREGARCRLEIPGKWLRN
jgi:PAS domain S-box-containing protein